MSLHKILCNLAKLHEKDYSRCALSVVGHKRQTNYRDKIAF